MALKKSRAQSAPRWPAVFALMGPGTIITEFVPSAFIAHNTDAKRSRHISSFFEGHNQLALKLIADTRSGPVAKQAWLEGSEHAAMMAAEAGAYDELNTMGDHLADAFTADLYDDYSGYEENEDSTFVEPLDDICDICEDTGFISVSTVTLKAIYEDYKDQPPFEYQRKFVLSFEQTPHGWNPTPYEMLRDYERIVAEWHVCKLCRKRFGIGHGF